MKSQSQIRPETSAHYIHLVGQTRSGKTAVCDLLSKETGFDGTLAFIRPERRLDALLAKPKFSVQYGAALAAGGRMKDSLVRQMVNAEIREIKTEQRELGIGAGQVIVTDGIMQSPAQVKWAAERGMLGSKSCVIVLESSARARPHDDVIAALKTTETQIYRTDASCDIPGKVLEYVMRHITFHQVTIPALESALRPAGTATITSSPAKGPARSAVPVPENASRIAARPELPSLLQNQPVAPTPPWRQPWQTPN